MARPPLPGGILIVIEGIDGAGKSTLARGVQASLVQAGATVNLSKEPTLGHWGMKLRESGAAGRLTVQKEIEYLLLDRAEHVNGTIAPALARDEVVILDRYFPSMVAYQGSAGLSIDGLMELNDFAPRPDLLLLLDLPPEVGLARIAARGDVPNAFETTETLTACRRIFLDLDMPKQVIDATESVEQVLAHAQLAVMRVVAEKARRAYGMSPRAVEVIGNHMPALAG